MTWTIGGRSRTFAPNALICLLAGGLIPLLGIWYLAATLYFVFHDQMLASLISRQTDMQYAYEDQVAELRTALDRETSRGLMDRQALKTAIRDLSEHSQLLETRAAIVERLVARNTKMTAAAKPSDNGSPNPLLAPGRETGLPAGVRAYDGLDPGPAPASGAALRLDAYPAAGETPLPLSSSRGDRRSDAGPPAAAGQKAQNERTGEDAIALALANAGRTQSQTLAMLREPLLRSVLKLRTALMEAGLGSKLAAASAGLVASDTGGPFVPLPGPNGGGGDFDQNAMLLEDAFNQAEKLDKVAAGVPFRKPVPGPLDVTSPFGARLDPFLGRPALHTGIDFRENYGSGVHATAAGTVTIAGTDGGYGTMVEIDHGNGLSTRYAHLSNVSVAPNQKVAAGDIIGHAGSSGRATGPHLHYETRIDGDPVDPSRFLRAGAKLFDE